MFRKISENLNRIRQLVECGETVIALYVEEEERPGQTDPDLKVYLATSHQAEVLKDALCEKRANRDVNFNSIVIRSRGAYDLSIGSYVAIVRV